LVVELDGDVHIQRKDHDRARDHILKSMGIKVIRISNENVASNIKRVISFIEEQLNGNNDSSPSLSKRGEQKG
jgi:very-short-patch-repair endonuclease